MVTKKELQELQIASKKINYNLICDKCDLEKQIRELDQETKELKREIENLKANRNNILNQGNIKANFVKNILSVIIGEAEPVSKYQVIRDMFLDEVKEFEESKRNRSNHNRHISYPSSPISESEVY